MRIVQKESCDLQASNRSSKIGSESWYFQAGPDATQQLTAYIGEALACDKARGGSGSDSDPESEQGLVSFS